MKRKIKRIGHQLRHDQFITIITKMEINEEPEEDQIDPSLETLSDERISPHTNNSRRPQVTDVNGYNNKAWPLEDDNDQNDLTGRT